MNHAIRIEAVDRGQPIELTEVINFQMTMDMLEFADQFSFEIPFDKTIYDAATLDSLIRIWVDDVPTLTGFVDTVERSGSRNGSMLAVSARDRGGRLVDESAPLKKFLNMDIVQLAEAMTKPWFKEVSLSNARNRDLLRGRRARKARAFKEPAIGRRRDLGVKVEPGESRISVLQRFLEQADLLAWSSGDGETFVIGKPNYDQGIQYRFFAPGENSSRMQDGNVLSYNHRQDASDRFAKVVVCGSSNGDSVNYGKRVTSRRGVSEDSTGTFKFPKTLIIQDDDIRTRAQAHRRAAREMALLNAAGETLSLEVQGWGQTKAGQGAPALFAFDTLALWEDEGAGVSGDWYVTRIDFSEDKNSGQIANLTLVPKGTELRIS